MLCAKFCLNWSSGSWEEDEIVKSLQTDGQTDGGWQVIRKANLSFQLRWAKTRIQTKPRVSILKGMYRRIKDQRLIVDNI